ncbi:MAG: M13 family metallopeptidase N-terminal domain-containing protein, partial [Pseudomonadota bacterium]
MMKQVLFGTASVALFFMAACGDAGQASQAQPMAGDQNAAAGETGAATQPLDFDEPALNLATPDTWGDWGVNLETMDLTVHPGDNFYRFMHGAWLDAFDMPSDRSRYGAFSLLAEKSEQRVRAIIEALAEAEPDPATLEGKVAALYNAYMDTAAIEAAGLEPARPMLDAIAAIETREDLAMVFA